MGGKGKSYSDVLVAVAAGLFGGFVFAAFSHFFQAGSQWCTAGDNACIREWVSATGGWAAIVAAVITIYLLQIQLNDARRSNERQLRAYIFVTETKIIDFGKREFEIQALIKNCGQTPAYDCVFEGSVVAGDPRKLPAPVSITIPYGVIGPGSEKTISVCPGPDEALVIAEAFDAQACHIYLLGDLCYTDVFDRRRCTKFKLEAVDMLDIRAGKLAVSATGNSAD